MRLIKTILGLLMLLTGVGLLFNGFWDLKQVGSFHPPPSEVFADDNQVDSLVIDSSAVYDSITARQRENHLKQLLLDRITQDEWSVEEIAELTACLASPNARYQPKVVEINATHVETAEQYAHQRNQPSMEMSRNFWQTHSARMDSITVRYGVPASIVAAILKVESNFGNWVGKHNTFNVYWRLSLGDLPEVADSLVRKDYPDRDAKLKKIAKRARWGRGQLRHLIYMSQHGGMDPLLIKGSWAGAIGMAQFIPASYRAYGRDGNGDGVVDLDNLDDAAASIAFYLKKNHWKTKADRKHHIKVIKTYNRSENYAECILDLAEKLGGFHEKTR